MQGDSLININTLDKKQQQKQNRKEQKFTETADVLMSLYHTKSSDNI